MKKYLSLFLFILFFAGVFYSTINPLTDVDFWTHVKAGQLVLQSGIQHKDVFSYTAYGRTWYQDEWLFEVLVYSLYTYIGPWAVQAIIAFVSTLQVGLVFWLLRKIFSLKTLSALFLCFLYFATVYTFLVARPQVFGLTFLITNLFLLLLFIYKKKNLLWISIPITLLWTNMHASVVFNVFLFGGFSLVSGVTTSLEQSKNWSQTKVLLLFTLLTFICTILPPLGPMQYQLVQFYVKHAAIIRDFIDEWRELQEYTLQFILFSGFFLLVITWFIALHKNSVHRKQALWMYPLLTFPILSYISARNTYVGYLVLVLLLGWNITATKAITKSAKMLICLGILFGLGYGTYTLITSYVSPDIIYPVAAVQFIKQNHLQGHMFHDYDYGGYLLYNLYPEQHVFIDGRADVYACCEMPALKNLEDGKYLPDNQYKKLLDIFWNKYDISFVLVKTKNQNVWQKIGSILGNDPEWSLVFWSDDREIFIRHDGKNEGVIARFGVNAATPYAVRPYQRGKQEEAIQEYQRMISIVDSAHSRNGLGFIYLQQNNIDQAQKEFEKAITLDPTFDSPYMNLGEIAAYEGNYSQAVSLYEKAQQLDPNRPFITTRLLQLRQHL